MSDLERAIEIRKRLARLREMWQGCMDIRKGPRWRTFPPDVKKHHKPAIERITAEADRLKAELAELEGKAAQ